MERVGRGNGCGHIPEFVSKDLKKATRKSVYPVVRPVFEAGSSLT
jgi:hypothetical protein